MKGLSVWTISIISILLALSGCGETRDGKVGIKLIVPCDPLMEDVQNELAMVCLSILDSAGTAIDGPNCSETISGVKLSADEKTKPVVVLVEGYTQASVDKFDLVVRGRSAPVTLLSGVDSTVPIPVAPVGRFGILAADSGKCQPLPMPVSAHTATVFPSGHVLIVGSAEDGINSDMVAELFDTHAGQLQRVPTPNSLYRSNHTATLLDDGRLLVAGGILNNGSGAVDLVILRGAEPMMSQYNPAVNYTSRLEFETLPARLPGPFPEPASALFFGQQVLLVDGSAHAQMFLGQDESMRSFDSGNIPAFPENGHTATPVAYDSGSALIGGLQNRTGRILVNEGGANAVLYLNPDTLSMRDRAVGLLLQDGRVMILGHRRRFDQDDAVLVMDPPAGTGAPDVYSIRVPSEFPEKGFSATVLPDGRVLVLGGLTRVNNPAKSFFLVPDDTSENWDYTPGPELNLPRVGHSAVMLPDGRLMVIGGKDPSGGQAPTTSVEVISF